MSKQNKKQLTITVNGQEYPYIETMGALLGFKNETGLDIPADLEDNLKYMYHVVKAVCRREKREFDMSFGEFADGLDAEEFNRVLQAINANGDGEAGNDGKKNG